jgi:hypothetical protein
MAVTLTRMGQVNAAGDANALFLKKFGGEVLTAFRRATKFIERHTIRTIDNGYAASFPATWRATASYHTPGTEITGQVFNNNERLITIDDLLTSPVFIYRLDEAKNHWDARKIYTEECGLALARAFDQNVARVGLLAARGSATVTGANGGTQIVSATSKTDADALIAAAFAAAQAMDEKDVPEEGRVLFLKPAQYYLLVNSGSKLIHADYNQGGSNGSVASGMVFRVAGMEIVKTNHLPITDESADATVRAAYRGDWSTTAGLAMSAAAAGTVKLLDLAVESDYLIQHQGTLVVAKYAMGHGILRPECAAEIKTA